MASKEEKIKNLEDKLDTSDAIIAEYEKELERIVKLLENARDERDAIKLEKEKLENEETKTDAGITKVENKINGLEAKMIQFHNKLKNIK